MGRKTTVLTFQTTNKRNLKREKLYMAKKGKILEKNLFSSDSSTEQRHKDKLCQSKNIQDVRK